MLSRPPDVPPCPKHGNIVAGVCGIAVNVCTYIFNCKRAVETTLSWPFDMKLRWQTLHLKMCDQHLHTQKETEKIKINENHMISPLSFIIFLYISPIHLSDPTFPDCLFISWHSIDALRVTFTKMLVREVCTPMMDVLMIFCTWCLGFWQKID